MIAECLRRVLFIRTPRPLLAILLSVEGTTGAGTNQLTQILIFLTIHPARHLADWQKLQQHSQGSSRVLCRCWPFSNSFQFFDFNLSNWRSTIRCTICVFAGVSAFLGSGHVQIGAETVLEKVATALKTTH